MVLPVGFEQNPEAGEELVDSTVTRFGDGDRFDAFVMVPGDQIP